ncbi:MAG: hypothetical protein KAT68_07050 [Bacteroidales bacterium]|nr:hypothetical protein [Bacteroidales bacterium]
MKLNKLRFNCLTAIVLTSLIIIQFGCSKTEETENQAPTCTIISPQNNDEIELGNTETISVDANDTDGSIIEVRFYIDDIGISSTESIPYIYEWLTTDFEIGIHTIKAVAKDNDGNSTSDEIAIFLEVSCPSSVTDYDGNEYNVVLIGNQCWMAENLKTMHYANGTAIPLVEITSDWDNLGYTDKAYCYYDNSTTNSDTYGTLYTWAAIMNGATSNDANPSGVQGVCPDGWHIPSDDEWKELEMYLGMSQSEADAIGYRGTDEGDKLKVTNGWYSNGNGTNSSGFTVLPAGYRNDDGAFFGLGYTAFFWSSTEYSSSNAWRRTLGFSISGVHRINSCKNLGFSARCLKD